MRGLVLVMLLGTGAPLTNHNHDHDHDHNHNHNHKGLLDEVDLIQLSGVWYEVALATQPEKHGARQRPRRIGVVRLELVGYYLSLVMAYDTKERRCVKEKTQMKRGGSLQFRLQRNKGNEDVRILGTDYTSFIILEVVEHGSVNSMYLKLYSRVPETPQKVLRRFYEKVEESGLSSSDVLLLVRDMTCVQLLRPII